MHLKSGLILTLTIVAGCSHSIPRSRAVDPQLAADYQALISMFPEDDQGVGRETIFKTVEEQPMTYGLILMAEGARFARTANPEAARRVRKAARWVIDNQDLDRDGQPGWGLPQAWDAFQDGSTNPPNQPYTITTALVMYGLLDSLKTPVWTPDEREEIQRLLARVAVRWCGFWSEGFSGGFFWYSSSRADALFAVNSPAMMMGAMARVLREQSSSLTADQHKLVQQRIDDQARAVVATVGLRDGLPYWAYMPLPNFRNSDRPNDLIHHVYTLWGVEVYRDCGGTVRLPWNCEQAVGSLDRFWREGRIVEFPEVLSTTRPAGSSQPAGTSRSATPGKPSGVANSPAILWSAGMLLGGYARWGDRAGASRTLEAIKRDYGPWPNLRLYPPERSGDNGFYSRYAAHVLLGMAWHVFDERGA